MQHLSIQYFKKSISKTQNCKNSRIVTRFQKFRNEIIEIIETGLRTIEPYRNFEVWLLNY